MPRAVWISPAAGRVTGAVVVKLMAVLCEGRAGGEWASGISAGPALSVVLFVVACQSAQARDAGHPICRHGPWSQSQRAWARQAVTQGISGGLFHVHAGMLSPQGQAREAPRALNSSLGWPGHPEPLADHCDIKVPGQEL